MPTSTITFDLDESRETVMDIAATETAGSRVTFFIDMRPRGALRPLSPVLKVGMPREMAKRPEQFRAALAGR